MTGYYNPYPHGYERDYFDYENGFLIKGSGRRPRKSVPPPKPVAPTGTELLQSYATTHRARAVSSGVKFATREHLMLGLDYIAGRNISGALSHTLQAVDEIDRTGMAAPMLMMVLGDKNDWYERNIRKPIEAISITDEFLSGGRRMFQGDWDYDGPGPWHKSNLKVWADFDGFYLHHYAAYVGNKREVRMAEALGDLAILNVVRYEHRLTYETHGDRWQIPLDDLRAAYSVFGKDFDPNLFMAEFLTPPNPEGRKDKWAPITGPVIINPNDQGIQGSISLGYNNLREDLHDRDPKTMKPLDHHAYRIEGDFLTGPAAESWKEFQEDWRRPIDLTISITPLSSYNKNVIEAAGLSSNVLTTYLQRIQKRPDPYPNE